MNKQRKTSHILNVFQYDADGHVVLPASLTLGIVPGAEDNSGKVPSTAWVRSLVTTTGGSLVPTNRSITINGTSYDLSSNRSWSIDTGVLTATAGAGISVSVSNQNLNIVNTGLLTGTAGAGISVSTVNQNLNIVNTGLLTGTAGAGITVTTVNQNLNIVNTGLLTATSGAGITVTTSNQNVNIVNTGLLTATAGAGITVTTSNQNVNIVNNGILTATAGAGISVTTSNGNLNIVNTITNNNQLDNGAGYATTSYVTTQINNLVAGAPGLLDTLDELAAALGDDANFATTITTSISTKQAQLNGTGFVKVTGTTVSYDNSTYLTTGTAASTYVSLTGSYSNPSWITALGWGKITGTPTTISGYGITNAYTDAQIQNFFNGANAITGYNKSNWDTTHGWGNHASAGYLTTSSAASTYVSLTGSYANPSWITSLAYSKLTGVPAFLTSYTEVDTLASVTARGASTSTAVTFSTNATIGRVLIDFDGTDTWFRMQSGNRMRITTTGGTDFIIPNTGNMTYNGNTVWHSGNLTNLNQLTNGPGYLTSLPSHNHDGVYMKTNRTLDTINTIDNGGDRYNPSVNNPTNEHYAVLTYGNGGNVTGQLATHFVSGQLYSRGYNSSWSSWLKYVVENGGTWGISITGNAATVGGYSVSASVGANTVVIRDVNNYIYAHYINSNVSETENPTINSFYTSNGDGWLRKSSLAHVRNQLGNYGNWITSSGSITGDAGTVGGISASRIVYGDNSTATTYISNATLDGALKSGFYTVGSGGIPNATGVNFVLHTAYYSPGNAAGFDLACNDSTTSQFYLRPATGGGKGAWQTIVTNSGTWGISITGNAATVGGYAVAVGGSANTIPTRNSSGYLIPENWIQFNGIYGLYSPTNNAHLRPNDASYGSWLVTGARNGWQGFEFNSGGAGNVVMMISTDSNTSGFHNNSYGWQTRWANGTLYVGKNSYGGNEATVLDSSNYSSWAQQRVYQGQSSGNWQNFTNDVGEFRVDEVLDINGGGHSNQPPSVYTYGGVLSWRLANHSFQLYASHTGDITFKTQWGNDNYSGWRRILHESNYNSWAPSLTGGGASGTWGISITGNAQSSTTTTHLSSRTDGAWYNVIWGAGSPSYLYSSDSVRILSSEGALRANIYYDNNDTAYYLNPAGGSRLRNLYVGDSGDDWSDPGGWGTQVRFSNGPHVRFVLHARTPGIEAGMYVHTPGSVFMGSYTSHDVTLMRAGNTRMVIYDSYIYSTVYMEAAGSMRAPIFYDSNNTGYYFDGDGGTNLQYLNVNGSWASSPFASGHAQLNVTGSYASITQRATQGAQAYILHHIDDRYSLYIGRGATNGTDWDWALRAYPKQDGSYVEFRTSARAPIFYDSADTGYYLDPNSTSELYKFSFGTLSRNGSNPLHTNSPWSTRAAQSSPYQNGTMGWGQNDLNTIGSYWGSGFIDTWSTPSNGPGASTHYVGMQAMHYNDQNGNFHGWQMVCAQEASNRWFWRSSWNVPNRPWVEMIHSGNIGSQSVSYASSTGSVAWGNVSGRPTAVSSFSNDSGYVTSGGEINRAYRGIIQDTRGGQRTPNDYDDYRVSWEFTNQIVSGWHSAMTLQGWHDGYAAWQIIGWSDGGTSDNWYLRSGNGTSWGSLRTIIHSGNIASQTVSNSDMVDGYHASNFLGFQGNSYYQVNTWLQMNGTHGIYWPSYYGSHIYVNTTTTYTNFRWDGQKNGYDGVWLSYSSVNGMMYDSGGNGGVYREANGRWYWYHHVGNNCTGISTSSTSSSYRAYIGGALYAEGDIVAYSDVRKKTDIVTIDNALEKVINLRGVYYTRIDDTARGRQTGVIAQEINQVLPEVVTYASDVDEYGVSYGNIVGVLIEAIKEQQLQIEELKNKLDNVLSSR